MKKLFQFWEGNIPTDIKADMAKLADKAEEAGWTYEFYDFKRLLNELEDEDVKESLRRMKKYLPVSMFGSAASDYFRYWCLRNGGLYCDTDVILTTDVFPELPNEGVWFTSEQTRRENLNTAVTLANGQEGMLYSRAMQELAEERLKYTWLGSYEQCKVNAEYLKANKWSLISFLGPAFVRNRLPMLINAGVHFLKFPYEISSSHDPSSLLFHGGLGSWIANGTGNKENLYEKLKKSI